MLFTAKLFSGVNMVVWIVMVVWKLIWSIVGKNYSSDRENFANSRMNSERSKQLLKKNTFLTWNNQNENWKKLIGM